MGTDSRDPEHATRDAEWLARHSALDRALSAAIRAPIVDARFDEQVWASIRADEAKRWAPRSTPPTRLGMPWWLEALNAVALAVTVVVVASALRSTVTLELAAAAAEVSSFVEHSTRSVVFVLVASAAGCWLALRSTLGRGGARL